MARNLSLWFLLVVLLASVACGGDSTVEAVAVHVDADTGVEFVSVDRFSDDAGTIMRRSDNPALPAPNEAIDYDADFLSHALSPSGEGVSYYAFDVSSLLSAPVYAFAYASGPSTGVDGQAPVFDVIPGDEGYNDFWQMVRVLVPDNYEVNSLRSLEDIENSGFELERTGTIINCPIVPFGSTADLAERDAVGWYKGKHVQYFSFESLETSIVNPGSLDVPYAVVRVIFEGNDPSKGMKIDPDTGKTHNVFDTIPGDELYRALWRHDFVDESEFGSVHDWESSVAAIEAEVGMDNILVNCPVVIWPGSQVSTN